MDSKDWYNCGAKIGDLVQNAIDSNNFKSLNDSIIRTISQSLDAAADSLQGSTGQNRKKTQDGSRPGVYRGSGSAYDKAKSDANVEDMLDVLKRSFAGTNYQGKSTSGSTSGTSAAGQTPRRSLRGIFSMVVGYGAAVGTAFIGLCLRMGALLLGIPNLGLGIAFFGVLTAIFAYIGARGGGYRARLRQLEQYMKIMDGRDVVTIEELAHGSGKSVKEVQKDLKAMIKDGMFASEAYMDPDGTNLMTSRKAYQQYQDTMKACRQRQAEREKEKAAAGAPAQEAPRAVSEEQRRENEKNLASYSDETRKILQDGREFIREIHEANDKIPGEEISDKLYRLEEVVTRIFDQVAAKPDSAPDMHKMMSYYLPITRKLVQAYVDLDSSSVQGENVSKTKQEIEMSLDTINLAFETFLDSFYQDTAWDISSDISALKTMMARDGLTGAADFGRTRKVGKDVKKAEQEAAAAAGVPVEEAAYAAPPAQENMAAGPAPAVQENTAANPAPPVQESSAAAPAPAAQQGAAGSGAVAMGGGAAAVMKEE